MTSFLFNNLKLDYTIMCCVPLVSISLYHINSDKRHTRHTKYQKATAYSADQHLITAANYRYQRFYSCHAIYARINVLGWQAIRSAS